MAIFVTDCAICGERITKDTPCVTTSGVAFPPPHPLYQFCDAGLHQKCLLTWEHRGEFAAGYAAGSGNILRQENEWNLICGPMGYGPHGKPGWPYYAEIRLCDWPIRLYSRFEEWGTFVMEREWEEDFIPEINEVVRRLEGSFPRTDEDLRQYLWQPLVETMLHGEHYRTRYIAAVSLNLFDDNQIRTEINSLKRALEDEHGSVRNAAQIILKRLRTKGIGENQQAEQPSEPNK